MLLSPALSGAIGLLIVVGGLVMMLIVGGLVMIWRGYQHLGLFPRLQREGRLAQAIVFKKWIDTDSDGDSFHYVAYAFHADIPGKGVELITRTELSRELYQKAPVGGTLTVRYLPDDPKYCFAEAPVASPDAHNQ